MKQTNVNGFFRNLADSGLNQLVDRAQAGGRKALAYTCSFVPEAMLNVDGLFGVRLRAPGVMGTPMADTYLSNVICSFTRSLLESALEGTFDSLDGWVFAASCDHMRRLYDNLRYLQEPPFVHILDVPHKVTPAALDWMEEELEDLAGALSRAFDVDMGKAALSASIARQNEFLSLVKKIGELRKLKEPPLSGTEFVTILCASLASPKDLVIGHLKDLAESLAGAEGIGDYRARLLLAGSICDDPGYIRVIEQTGGLVVGDRTCIGSLPGLSPIPESDAPLRDLAAHSLSNLSCPRMMEGFHSRVEEILSAVKEFKADGVVLETMKFCDTWGVEASPMVSAIREAGIPVLRLEREYALSSEGQLSTRIQAFLESMGK